MSTAKTKTTSSPRPTLQTRVEALEAGLQEVATAIQPREVAAAVDPAHEASWNARRAQQDAVQSARMTTLSVILSAIRVEINAEKCSTLRVKNLAEAAAALGSNSLY